MRLALVLFLVGGLVPGLAEVVETVTHYVEEGHLAHSAADEGDLGDQGDEHGCGTTEHHCGCCTSQVAAAAGARVGFDAVAGEGPALPAGVLASLHEPAPPHRPPIAS